VYLATAKYDSQESINSNNRKLWLICESSDSSDVFNRREKEGKIYEDLLSIHNFKVIIGSGRVIQVRTVKE